MNFSNPLTHPMFFPLAIAIVGALLAAFGYALFSERKRLRQFHKSSLCPKLISSAILAPAATLCILSGPGGVFILATAMALIGVLEYASVTSLARTHLPLALAGAIAVTLVTALAPQFVMHVMVGVVLLMASVAVFAYRTPAAGSEASEQTRVLLSVMSGVLCVAYAPLLGSFAIRLSTLQNGAGLILALIASVALSDTMAFVVGKAFGKRKLAPHVSPNKTVAGLFGNILGAYMGFLLMQFVCGPLPLVALVVLPFFIAIGSVVGDLFESLIKRSYGVKDAGTWLPGFGGLLDRIDSLLFVMPVAYLFLSLVV